MVGWRDGSVESRVGGGDEEFWRFFLALTSAKVKNRLSGFEDGITAKPIKIERIGLYKNGKSRA
jgi:hypothetical protein